MRRDPSFTAVIAASLFLSAWATAAHAAWGHDCPCHANRPLAIPAEWFGDASATDPVRALRIRLDRNPEDATVRNELLKITPAQSLPKESEAYTAARQILPPRFVEHQTRRFIVLSDASPEWTRAQAERLERAHHQFVRYCARLGLEPLPLEHKLVCVLFERREDYRTFAAEHDDVRDAWVAGYYSPRHDRIVFYNIENDPQVRDARSKLETMEREMDALNHRARRLAGTGLQREAVRLRQTLARYEDHVNRERGRVDAFTQQVSIATTIHEAVHQLAFHTRIQSPYVQNPLWLSEGLATAFETETPNAAFGPEHEYMPRRRAFSELLEQGDLLPLKNLVGLTTLSGADNKTVRTFYHQSYALMTWLGRFRRDELRIFFQRLRKEQPSDHDEQVALFEEIFGDVASLERAWLRYEQGR